MKIYIELVILLILMSIFIGWRIWFIRSKKKLLREYKPKLDMSKEIQNGKSKKGGIFGNSEQGTGIGTTEPRVEPSPTNPIGSKQLEGSELLQATDVDDVRENSSGTRENSSTVRSRFFRRKK